MAAPTDRRPSPDPQGGTDTPSGTSRRHFLGWVLAAPAVAAGVGAASTLRSPQQAGASIISPPEFADLYDLGDLQDEAALPTANLIEVSIDENGDAYFAIPRAEVGQGITTSTAMTIAEEIDLPVSRVHVTLADSRPELIFNQLTGGSNTTRSTYVPVRMAAGLARLKLRDAASQRFGEPIGNFQTRAGVVFSTVTSKRASYGSLAEAASHSLQTLVGVQLKDPAEFKVIGRPYSRVDALLAVTGQKQFTADLQVPDALPTMICRAPTIMGTPNRILNADSVRRMSGITDVAMIATGVAVRGRTFGECIDAVRALKVKWNPGTEDGKSDPDILAELHAAELPMTVPELPVGATTIDESFTFYFASNSPLETGIAIADVRSDSVEVWSPLKVPIVFQEDVASELGLPIDSVKVHVTEGGGSFGRHLFSDAALEAVRASKAFGKPVKLMWHRTDDFRQGRTHPMCTSRVRATYLGDDVLTYEQRHTSVSTDFTHGLGEILTAYSSRLPEGNFTFAQSIFLLTANVSYNYGITDQLLNEVNMGFPTGSMRNIYSPDVAVAQELVTDKIAALAGKDRYAFRREFVKDARGLAVLDKVAKAGRWGRKLPDGFGQGIAVHNEYKGWAACLVEIDCRPETVRRQIRDAYTGPRVTKVVYAVDVGLPINPRGLEAQMQGGIMDGIALALTSSLHLRNGHFLEGSWDNYWYTRQWNVPPDVRVIIMPATSTTPGGAGEFGVAATKAAVACAYGAATGRMPTSFPINHNKPLGFEPLPTVPSIPQSPTNGLRLAY